MLLALFGITAEPHSPPLCSGSRSGQIHHHDVRVAEHHVATLSGHSQEVCGLRWAPDGRHLASGGNDNLVNVWPSAPGEGGWVPLQTFTQHQGAVKVRVRLGLGWGLCRPSPRTWGPLRGNGMVGLDGITL